MSIYSNDSTSKERDAETGLDYFKARYMASGQGRFTSPDPILISRRRILSPQLWNAYSYVGNNPLRFIDPTGQELIQLGQHSDDEVKKRTQQINQELKNKGLTKEQRSTLNAEKKTLAQEQQGNRVVGNLLEQLDKIGQGNGQKLSDFTLSTDTRKDFAGRATPDALTRMMNDQAFVVQGVPGVSGTIYVRTEPQYGFYRMSQMSPDFAYYGASAISHEGVHLLGGGEYPAYQRQDAVLHGFRSFFGNSNVFKTFDESIEEGIRSSAPQR